MENNEAGAKVLRIALASYDPRELRVQKNYLQEQTLALECSCYRSGRRLLEQIRCRRPIDVVVLNSELEDMNDLEFIRQLRRLDRKPLLMLLDSSGPTDLLLAQEPGWIRRTELQDLVRDLYRLPGQAGQDLERRCRQLYAEWGIPPLDINCSYLNCAVGLVCGTPRKMAIRKEILQAVSQQYDTTVTAVDSSIRRMIEQLEARPTRAWECFKKDSGLAGEKPTTGKLIYAVKNHLSR